MRLMVLVALAGLVAGAETLRRRSRTYSETARRYADYLAAPPRGFCSRANVADVLGHPAGREAREYYEAMRDKYRRAASRPWESVAAGPPRPAGLMWDLGELTSADDW